MVGSEYNGEEQGPCHEESKKFQLEFKRQAVEELVSRESGLAQLRRRYDVTSSLLYHWKRQYSRGKFNGEPSEEGAVRDGVQRLERLVGKLTLENEVLKRGGSTASVDPGETADRQGMGMSRRRHPAGVSGDEAFNKRLL